MENKTESQGKWISRRLHHGAAYNVFFWIVDWLGFNGNFFETQCKTNLMFDYSWVNNVKLLLLIEWVCIMG